MCDFCSYKIICDICGKDFEVHGKPSKDDQPCGSCYEWAVKLIRKIVYPIEFIYPPASLIELRLIKVRPKPVSKCSYCGDPVFDIGHYCGPMRWALMDKLVAEGKVEIRIHNDTTWMSS